MTQVNLLRQSFRKAKHFHPYKYAVISNHELHYMKGN